MSLTPAAHRVVSAPERDRTRHHRDAELSGAECLALVTLTVPALAVLGALALDAWGLTFRPGVILAGSVTGACAVAFPLRRRLMSNPWDTSVLVGVFAALTAWLLWLARPGLLPMSTGPDLTHHLMLIDYIEQHWRLVHDPSMARQLGEMAAYTPGAHILAALTGAWSGTDGLHAFHAVQCGLLALETGVLVLIAGRTLPLRAPHALALLVVPLLLAAPRYLLGAVTEFGFFSQTVAQVFVIAAWWAIAVWDQLTDWRLCLVAGVASAVTFLIWPVYSGPSMLTMFLVVMARMEMSWGQRVRHVLVAVVPFVVVAVPYLLGRLGWLRLAGTGGTAPWPSVASFSLPLVLLAVGGVVVLLARRRGRVTLVFVAALLAQTSALYIVATGSGAPQPYMALKMFYLLLRPMVVCGAVAAAWLWQRLSDRVWPEGIVGAASAASRAAWAVPLGALALAAWPLWSHPRVLQPNPPAVSSPLYDAARWARANLPPGCIEYLVSDDETAYWLHLAVLRNPRMSDRTGDNSTYEPTDAIVRWLTPGGLPYAIADLATLPRDIRDELDIVHTNGSAAVAKRRGPSTCAMP